MFEMQKALDERIIKEKGLEGQDLLPNTYVALDTELAEFANEGAGSNIGVIIRSQEHYYQLTSVQLLKMLPFSDVKMIIAENI